MAGSIALAVDGGHLVAPEMRAQLVRKAEGLNRRKHGRALIIGEIRGVKRRLEEFCVPPLEFGDEGIPLGSGLAGERGASRMQGIDETVEGALAVKLEHAVR